MKHYSADIIAVLSSRKIETNLGNLGLFGSIIAFR